MRSPPMRALLAGAALVLATISSAPAALGQGGKSTPFEGVVTFQVGEGTTFDYAIRQGLVRVELDGSSEGAIMLVNSAAHKMYMLMPSQEMYMEMSVPDAGGTSAGLEGQPKPTRTGRTEIVAGHKCEYWVVRGDGVETEVCLASDLGSFHGFGNPMARGSAPSWQREFGNNHFPLKVIGKGDDGKEVVMVATKVERKALDAAMFKPPASYRKMEMNMRLPGTPPR